MWHYGKRFHHVLTYCFCSNAVMYCKLHFKVREAPVSMQENPIYLAKMERERIARGETVKDSKGGKKGKK